MSSGNTAKDFESIKAGLGQTIGYAAISGLRTEIAQERRVRLVMPLADIHKNHVGAAYAGSIFVIGEIAAAGIVRCTYGSKNYIPILSKAEITYIRPAKEDLVVDVSMTQEEAEEKIAYVQKNGKGKIPLQIPIQDASGRIVAEMSISMYLIKIQNKETEND